jgi:hypothetical protein
MSLASDAGVMLLFSGIGRAGVCFGVSALTAR